VAAGAGADEPFVSLDRFGTWVVDDRGTGLAMLLVDSRTMRKAVGVGDCEGLVSVYLEEFR